MPFDINQATGFVKSVDLSGTPRGLVKRGAGKEAGDVFDKAKTQAQVLGSGVFSFAQGVTTDVREAISDSALLAQLVANQKAKMETDPLAWFNAYSDVLQNVGWVLQESGWTDYTTSGTAVDVHQKIVEAIGAALGPAPAVLAIITATVNMLKGMEPDSPWITLFSRESQKATIARFQVGLVEKEQGSDVFVSLLACLIRATTQITQVLFFKFREDGATFQADAAKVSINRAALSTLGPQIRKRVLDYQNGYVSSVLTIVPVEAPEMGHATVG